MGAVLLGQTAEQQEARLQAALKAMNRMEHARACSLFVAASENVPYHPLAPFGALANEWISNQGKYGYQAGNRELLENINDVILDYRRRLVLDPDNPDLQYYIGLTNGLRARVLLAEKDWLGVLVSGYRIIRNIKSALKGSPDNPDITIAFGVFNYYVGLSSGFMRIASWILRISGSKEEGLQQIETAALHGNYSRYEARSILAYLYLYFEADYAAARRWLDMLIGEFPDNPYFNFLYAELCIRTGNPDIDTYVKMIRQRMPGLDPFFKEEYAQRLLLLEGSRALLKGDLELAESKLLDYLDNFNSEMDYDLASGYLRLGQVYDLQKKRLEAVEMYQKTVDLDNRSSAIIAARGYLIEPYSGK
jgi:tetratricopeptide (TPR) repeat protein